MSIKDYRWFDVVMALTTAYRVQDVQSQLELTKTELNNRVSEGLLYLHREFGFALRFWDKYRDWETDRKSTRLNSSHITRSRMPSSA